jgi:hypothetical protein
LIARVHAGRATSKKAFAHGSARNRSEVRGGNVGDAPLQSPEVILKMWQYSHGKRLRSELSLREA